MLPCFSSTDRLVLAFRSRVPAATGRAGTGLDRPVPVPLLTDGVAFVEDVSPAECGRLMMPVVVGLEDGGNNDCCCLLRIALDGRVFGVLDDDLLLGSSLSFSFSWTLFLK